MLKNSRISFWNSLGNSRFCLGNSRIPSRNFRIPSDFSLEILEFPTEFFNLEFLGILDFSRGILEFLEFLD